MTNLTTAQIARLTAEITGADPKGAASKDAAARRFRKVLAEAIGELNADARAENILGAASYDEAADFLRIALRRADAADDAERARLAETMREAIAPEASAEDQAEASRLAATLREAIKTAAPAPKPETAGSEVGDTSDPHALCDEMAAGKVRHTESRLRAVAEAGLIPPAPDFSAETHKRFRAKLAAVVAAVEARDIAALQAIEIKPISSSPKALARFRDAAVIALIKQAEASA